MFHARFVRWPILALMLAATAQQSPASPQEPYQVRDIVESGKMEEGGKSWFETFIEGMRFSFDSPDLARHDALWRVLQTAHSERRAVAVTFDVSNVSFDEAKAAFVFPLCSVRVRDLVFEARADCTRPTTSDASAERWLALALAELHGGTPARAIDLATAALDKQQLSPALEKIARRSRADAHDLAGYDETPGSLAGDQHRIKALADYRKLAKLADDADLQLDIGSALEDLGDYDGARAVYTGILSRWPNEGFRVTIRLAALARREGKAEQSLELINALVPRYGPDMGMRFHYHRGWTLNRLGRHYEAIADFTKGIEYQPDYPWAFLRRACAHAMVGNHWAAHEDMEKGLLLLRDVAAAGQARRVRHDVARASQIATELKAKIQQGASEPLSATCTGYWGEANEKREKSPLLRTST